jgi:hypothetical protein
LTCVICGFFGVVLGSFGIVAKCCIGSGVANWRISVVFLFIVVRKGSFCVVS